MPTMSINLPVRIYKQVENFCKVHGVKRSMLGRLSVVEYMKKHLNDPTKMKTGPVTLETATARIGALMSTGECEKSGCEKWTRVGIFSMKMCAMNNRAGKINCAPYKRVFGGQNAND